MDLGSTIKSLRQDRQWTQEELAKQLEVDTTYLSKVENNKTSSISEGFLRKISELFEVNPIELLYLAGHIPAEHRELILNNTKIQRDLKIKYREVSNQKTSEKPAKTTFYNTNMIERKVSRILLKWCNFKGIPMLTPPIPVEEIINELYSDEIKVIEDTDNILPDYAMAGIAENGNIYINNKQYSDRLSYSPTKRFTLAHELGHWELHFHDKNKDQMSLFNNPPETPLFKCRESDFSGHVIDWDETNANRFAASLLMPKDLVAMIWNNLAHNEDYTDEEVLTQISKIFEVSKQAMKIRLNALELKRAK